jgi:hypothetical protein
VGEARRVAVRNAALTLEIDCEHVEMLALAEILGAPLLKAADPLEARSVAVSNMKAYFTRRAVVADAEDFVALTSIIAAGYPGTNIAAVRSLWNE